MSMNEVYVVVKTECYVDEDGCNVMDKDIMNVFSSRRGAIECIQNTIQNRIDCGYTMTYVDSTEFIKDIPSYENIDEHGCVALKVVYYETNTIDTVLYGIQRWYVD